MAEQWQDRKNLIHHASDHRNKLPISAAVALLAIMVSTYCAMACNYSSTDYFTSTPGHAIKYRVTDDARGLAYSTWATAQLRGEGRFAFTFTESSDGDTSAAQAWLGGMYSYDSGLYLFDAGCPSDNEHDLYALFTLPEVFDSGTAWSHFGRDYSVEFVGPYMLNTLLFNDCIRVTVDNTQDSDDAMRGIGSYVAAKSVGIIEMVFHRSNGTQLRFEHLEHVRQQSRPLCGTLSGTAAVAAGELVVQLSDCDGTIRSLVDARGQFTMSVFGERTVLRVGYDHDGNGAFDPDRYPEYPKVYAVNCITGTVTTPVTDLALQVRSNISCENTDSDGDAIPDGEDNCLFTANANQLNSDGDSKGDACDNCPGYVNEDLADADGDGSGDVCDNCWKVYNPDQLDSNHNCPFPPYPVNPVCGDACELIDSDGDSVSDLNDNCQALPNADQLNSDGDLLGDACDNCPDFSNQGQEDPDGDGIGNLCDTCWNVSNPDQLDTDGTCSPPPYSTDPACGDACNGMPSCGNTVREGEEACDGTDIGGETCLSQGYVAGGILSCLADCSDFDFTGCLSDDLDGDGVANESDNCPALANPEQTNSDSDFYGDTCDNCPLYGNENQLDVDEDGIGNVCDNCLMVYNPNQLDSNRDCYPPPHRADPVCGDACESPHELAMSALLGSTALEHQALENMLHGDCKDLQMLITEANARTDFIITAMVDAWERGELTAVSAAQVWKGRLAVGMAHQLNALAIRMLNHDQPWRRKFARALVQGALRYKEYVIEILER